MAVREYVRSGEPQGGITLPLLSIVPAFAVFVLVVNGGGAVRRVMKSVSGRVVLWYKRAMLHGPLSSSSLESFVRKFLVRHLLWRSFRL